MAKEGGSGLKCWIALLALSGICSGQSPAAHCVFYREGAIAGKALHASIRIDSISCHLGGIGKPSSPQVNTASTLIRIGMAGPTNWTPGRLTTSGSSSGRTRR